MRERLIEVAESLGAPRSMSRRDSGDLDEWFERAAGRPAFQLWGKAHDGQPWPMHPLLCHMLDVAAVAARMLAETTPHALRDRLLAIDPDRERAFRTLLFVIALHDFGKATPAFQSKRAEATAPLSRYGFNFDQVQRGDRHHGDIGFWMLTPELTRLRAHSRGARALARAVVAHHGEFPLDECREPGRRQLGQSPTWSAARAELREELRRLFGVDWPIAPAFANHDAPYAVSLAGLTSVADWVGSMDEVFNYTAPPQTLREYWPLALARAATALQRAGLRTSRSTSSPTFRGLFPNYEPWPLHRLADELAPTLDEPSFVVVEAPMGEGKTETALLLAASNEARASQDGFFIGLPTQATANQMFTRVREHLLRTRADATTLLLAHGEASLVERFREVRFAAIYDREDERGRVRAEQWFLSKKRTLLGQHAVGTIDQALLSVMHVPHGFVRVFGLAGKTVILDEVHAYDTYTSQLMDRLVEWLAAVGASVVLLSATLPSSRRRALAAAYSSGRGLDPKDAESQPYPRVTVTTSRGTSVHGFAPRRPSLPVEVAWTDPSPEAVIDAALERTANGGCAGCIFNTVARAQQAYVYARGKLPELTPLLLHARLLPDERLRREEQLASLLGPRGARPDRVLVIGTQVLEQSLDVDFDVLLSDLAPIDLVIQRAGRLFRHDRTNRAANQSVPRLFVAGPNALDDDVFDEVAGVYSRLIVRRSFEALRAIDRLVLPDDIEPLIERVYDETLPEPGSDEYDAFLQHTGEALVRSGLASEKLLSTPSRNGDDDILRNVKVFLSEDDGAEVHERLRAETRLGPPSIDIVCLDRVGSRVEANGEPIDLETEPTRDQTAVLARRSIGVSRKSIVEALLAQECPPSWKTSALLRHRRPVVFEDGVAEVGGQLLQLDPELGLVFS